MKVLGISPLDKDSTVTLVEDGVITYAAAEERFTRVKLQDGFPWRAFENALEFTGTSAAEIDRVVYPFLPYDEETRLFERTSRKSASFSMRRRSTLRARSCGMARERVPSGRAPVPGLSDPNERFEKGLIKSVAYRLAGERGGGVAKRRQAGLREVGP